MKPRSRACVRRRGTAGPTSFASKARLKGALEEDARWRRDWREACAGSWLGDAEAEPSLNAVRQALKALEDLRAALKDCAELDHRIAAMEHDKQLFAANAGEIGQALGIDGARRRRRPARRRDRGPSRAGARRRAAASGKDEGPGGGAEGARGRRRGARGQREARLGDDRIFRRRLACRSRSQARGLQAT